MVRLQKLLANAGVASRRKAEEMITAGRVAVNGEVVSELGAKALETDTITVDGVPLGAEPEKMYIMLHKPEGVVTTAADPFGRPTVMDYIPTHVRLFPVGRLDNDTSGLLFLTNDGDWANQLTHPSHEVNKTYLATIQGEPTEEEMRTFETGIEIDGRLTAKAEIVIVGRDGDKTMVRITIHEGRNRQVRKMCAAIHHPVIMLKRVAVGEVKLGNLAVGKWRNLSESELTLCKK
jgi:23S rRNA pseudouridine2605 synthase